MLNQLAAGDCTYNTLDISIYDRSIGACRSSGNWQLANFFLVSMRCQRTFADAVCCSNAMSTCSKELQWHAATAMLQQMFIQAVVPDLVCLGAVLGTLQSAADLPVWTNALAILQQHPATRRSNICCNACISSCVRWTMTLDLLHDMAAAAVQRDGISISTTIASAEDRRREIGLISSFGNAGHPSRFSPPHSFDLIRFFPKNWEGTSRLWSSSLLVNSMDHTFFWALQGLMGEIFISWMFLGRPGIGGWPFLSAHGI